MTSIKSVSQLQPFQELLKSQPKDKLTVVDFWATWCGPCKLIAPTFQTLSNEYRHVTFVKVDVDASQDIAKTYGVTAMPTFMFFKNAQKVDELKGANGQQLTSLVNKHQGPKDENSGTSVGGHASVNEFIDPKQFECLNQQEAHTLKNALQSDDQYLESDVDEQLMITIPFHQVVRLHSIQIRAPKTQAPKTLRFYVNRYQLGFDEADDIEATQEVMLSEDDYKPVKEGSEDSIATVALRYVKFQSVNAVIMFVVDNIGEEETTVIKELKLLGTGIQSTNVGDLKKEEH